MTMSSDEIPSERNARLVYFRQLKGVTQREVGRALVPPRRREVVRDWEKGKNPTDETIWSQLDNILSIPPECSLAKETVELEKKVEETKRPSVTSAYDLIAGLESELKELRGLYENKFDSLAKKVDSLKDLIIKSESKTNGDFYLPRNIEKFGALADLNGTARYVKLCLYSAAEVLEQVKVKNAATREIFRKMVTGNEGLEIGYIGTFLSSFFDSDEKLKRWGEGLGVDHISYPSMVAVQEGRGVNIEKAANYFKDLLFNSGGVLEPFKKSDAESRIFIRSKFAKSDVQYLTSFINSFFGGEQSFTRWQEKFGDYKINYTHVEDKNGN